jgi:hypothetical protein
MTINEFDQILLVLLYPIMIIQPFDYRLLFLEHSFQILLVRKSISDDIGKGIYNISITLHVLEENNP